MVVEAVLHGFNIAHLGSFEPPIVPLREVSSATERKDALAVVGAGDADVTVGVVTPVEPVFAVVDRLAVCEELSRSVIVDDDRRFTVVDGPPGLTAVVDLASYVAAEGCGVGRAVLPDPALRRACFGCPDGSEDRAESESGAESESFDVHCFRCLLFGWFG